MDGVYQDRTGYQGCPASHVCSGGRAGVVPRESIFLVLNYPDVLELFQFYRACPRYHEKYVEHGPCEVHFILVDTSRESACRGPQTACYLQLLLHQGPVVLCPERCVFVFGIKTKVSVPSCEKV